MKTRYLLLGALALNLSAMADEPKPITRGSEVLACVAVANLPKGGKWSLPEMKAANDDLKAMIGKPGSFRLRVGNPQLSGSGASMIGVTDMVRFHGVNVQFHFRCQFAAIETVKNIKADNFVTVNGTISACGLTSETLLQISMKDCVLK